MHSRQNGTIPKASNSTIRSEKIIRMPDVELLPHKIPWNL
jgi:hypothetical protein